MSGTAHQVAKAVCTRLLRVCVAGLAILAAALAVGPALALATPLSCSGSTIYALQRPGKTSGEHGTVFGLTDSTVGGATATMTEVTQMPTNSYPNALGVAYGGTGLWAVEQAGSSGSATVWGYDSETGVWKSYLGSGGEPSGFVAGAVDPVNGIYYYADYTAGTSTSPGKATLYGFDTITDTAITGEIATFSLPDGDSAASENGDFTFDYNGNLYVLASNATTRGVGVIKAADVPSTATGEQLSITTLSSVADTATYNGIAFDNLGHLYLEGSSGGKYGVEEIDPNSGEVLEKFTDYSANAQSGSAADVDLGSCTSIPTLSADVEVEGRVSASDQFTLSITGGTITQGNTATTEGSATGLQSKAAGPVIGSSEVEYTFTLTAASGNLADYHISYSCVDTANGDKAVQSGTEASFKLKLPKVELGQTEAPPAIVCTYDLTPKEADLGVTDTVAPETALDGTQVTYTLTVTNHGPDTATLSKLTDTLPTGLTAASSTTTQGTCTTTSGLECSLGTIPSGSSVKVTLTANLALNTTGKLTDKAHVEAEQPDPELANNKASATIEALDDADLGVTDTVAPETAVDGTQVTYTLTVTNHGPDTATLSKLTDTLPTGLTAASSTTTQGTCTTTSGLECDLGTIPSGSSVKVTLTANLALNSTGKLTDKAHVEAEQPDPELNNNKASATIEALDDADLGVTDTVAPETALDGTQVTYTLTVTNHGPDTATLSKLTDTLPTGLTAASSTTTQGTCTTTSGLECDLGTIPSGSSVKVTLTANLALNSTGKLTDKAHVEAEQPDPELNNNKASATIEALDDADLGVTDTVAPETALDGTQVTYTLTVTNHGPDTATLSKLTDTLPTGLTAASSTTTQGTCTTTSGLECDLGTIPSGSSVKVTLTANLALNTTGKLTDKAHVEAEQPDPELANNKASATIEALDDADLGVTDTVAPETAVDGTQVTYTLTVTNHGPDTATLSKLTDTLPTGLTAASSTTTQGTCTTTSGLECDLGTIPSGSSVKVTLTANLALNSTGKLTDKAHVEAEQPDPELNNNKASATIEALDDADLGVTDTVAPETALDGTQVTYTLTVTNHGPDTATLSKLTDTLPTGLTAASSTTTQGTCTTTSGLECDLGTIPSGSSVKVTLTANLALNSTGKLTDKAHVEAEQPDPELNNNKASATIEALDDADLGVTDTVAPETALDGTQVTYTLTVTNHGPDTATLSKLTDTLPTGLTAASSTTTQGTCTTTSGLECDLGTIPSGSSVKVTLTANLALNTTGKLTDKAHVEAEQPDPELANNKASATIEALDDADLGVTDTVAPETAVDGTQVTYTLTVTNHGPDTATLSKLTDTLPTGLTAASSTTTQGTCTTTSGLECDLGTIPSGSSVKVTLTANLALNSTGKLTDKAHVEAEQPDPELNNNKASATIEALDDADLGVTDTVAPETALDGTQVTYTLTVTNHGPDTATLSKLTDTLPTGLTAASSTTTQGTCTTTSGLECDLGTIPSGSSVKVTLTANLALNSTGKLTDKAHVEAEQPDPELNNNKASATIEALDDADLGVTDTVAPETALDGTQVTYTLTVTNHGPDTATLSKLTDTLPTGLTAASSTTTQGTCTTTSGLECDLGTILSGSSVKVTLTANLALNTTGKLTDKAHVEAEQPDPELNNNKASATIEALPDADLGVTDTVAPETAVDGTQVTYTLTVTNHGPDTATLSKLTDTLPTGLTAASSTTTQGTCTTTSGLECSLGTIPSGSSVKVTLTANLALNTTGKLTDKAHVEAEQPDPELNNNKASATIEALDDADLGVTDTVAPETAVDGTQVTYTLTVTNHGPDTATQSVLTDILPTGLSAVSATTTQGTCTTTSGLECDLGTIPSGSSVKVTLTASLALNTTGKLTDKAHVEAEQPDPELNNNKASATIEAAAPTPEPEPHTSTPTPETPTPSPTPAPAPPPPPAAKVDVAVTTRVDSLVTDPGEPVTYTVRVTNLGTETAPDVVLVNTPEGPLEIRSSRASRGSCAGSSPVTCELGDIAPGEVITIEITGIPRGRHDVRLDSDANVECPSGSTCPKDINLKNNLDAALVRPRPRIHLREIVERKVVFAGEEVPVTLRVSNPSYLTLWNTETCAQLPLGLLFEHSARAASVHNGQFCWNLGVLTKYRVVRVTLMTRSLDGSLGTALSHSVATAADAAPAHSRGDVRIVARASRGPSAVTG